MNDFLIREIEPAEYPLLDDFLYEAVWQPPGAPPLPRAVTKKPELSIYTEEFGKPDDTGLVAEVDDAVVGAAWVRILSGEPKGYGYVDDQTPELAIALYPAHRGHGIGTEMIRSLLFALRAKGYRQVSLSVRKENRAVRLYQNLGFDIVGESAEDYLMAFRLG